jgi:TonB family protein
MTAKQRHEHDGLKLGILRWGVSLKHAQKMETERGRIQALPLGPIRPVKPSTGSEGGICHASGSRRLLRLSDPDKRSLNDVIAPRRRKVAVGRLWKFRNANSVGSPTTIFGFDNYVALATSAMKPTGVVGEIAWLRELSDVECLRVGFMLPRLLALLLLLSPSQLSLAQKSGTMNRVPETCPVTKPLDRPLVPPPPYGAQPFNSSVFWYGTDRFWTQLPTNAIWSQGEKTFWFRQDWSRYRNHTGPDQWIPEKDAAKLKVTAKRLDGRAPLPEVLKGNSSHAAGGALLIGGINFPTPGCWEISGRYESDELSFVVWVEGHAVEGSVRKAVPRKVQGIAGDAPGGLPPNVLGGILSSEPRSPRISTPTPLRVAQGVMRSFLVKKVNPSYPPEAQRQHVEGTVVVRVNIDKDGNVTSVEPVTGHALLMPAAIDAVKQWIYKPYLLNQTPVEVETTVLLEFVISGGNMYSVIASKTQNLHSW